jgi:hypothetical protein
MVNNVIGVVNYVIAARPSLRNFMIADTGAAETQLAGIALRAEGSGGADAESTSNSSGTVAVVPRDRARLGGA